MVSLDLLFTRNVTLRSYPRKRYLSTVHIGMDLDHHHHRLPALLRDNAMPFGVEDAPRPK
jgi:hypothetical protein